MCSDTQLHCGRQQPTLSWLPSPGPLDRDLLVVYSRLARPWCESGLEGGLGPGLVGWTCQVRQTTGGKVDGGCRADGRGCRADAVLRADGKHRTDGGGRRENSGRRKASAEGTERTRRQRRQATHRRPAAADGNNRRSR